MGKTIVIDAGHGGTTGANADSGAVNGIRREADDNLRLALAVQKLLAAQGQTVLMSRTQDVGVSLAARTNAANAADADLFVSLHRNSHTTASANGVEVWVYTTAGAVDVGAATEVLERLAQVGIQSNRGVKKGNYHVLRESKMMAILVELGFISNASDNKLFDERFDAYAEAIAKGICAALGEVWSSGSSAADDALYRVQVGAFRSEENARNFLETVCGMGIDAFLVIPEEAKAEQ